MHVQNKGPRAPAGCRSDQVDGQSGLLQHCSDTVLWDDTIIYYIQQAYYRTLNP